jgi:hypothetical protein
MISFTVLANSVNCNTNIKIFKILQNIVYVRSEKCINTKYHLVLGRWMVTYLKSKKKKKKEKKKTE